MRRTQERPAELRYLKYAAVPAFLLVLLSTVAAYHEGGGLPIIGIGAVVIVTVGVVVAWSWWSGRGDGDDDN